MFFQSTLGSYMGSQGVTQTVQHQGSRTIVEGGSAAPGGDGMTSGKYGNAPSK